MVENLKKFRVCVIEDKNKVDDLYGDLRTVYDVYAESEWDATFRVSEQIDGEYTIIYSVEAKE